VGISTDANTTMDTATEEQCFLCVPLRDVIKQDTWSNEFVMRQSPAGNNVSTEAEDIVGIRHQATTGEDVAN
jgi:hypothetical protein